MARSLTPSARTALVRRLLPALSLMALAACAGPDTDGDGLGDKQEARLGTDPAVPDSDADGLLDGDEVERGTDPLLADSDGDRFLDGEEIERGTDPLDMQSAYLGGWPVVDEGTKASLMDEPQADVASVGAKLPREFLVDQNGDTYDTYDMAQFQGNVFVLGFRMVADQSDALAWLLGEERAGYSNYNGFRDDLTNGDALLVLVPMGNLPLDPVDVAPGEHFATILQDIVTLESAGGSLVPNTIFVDADASDFERWYLLSETVGLRIGRGMSVQEIREVEPGSLASLIGGLVGASN